MDRFDRLVDLLTLTGEGGKLPIALAMASVTPAQQMVSWWRRPSYDRWLVTLTVTSVDDMVWCYHLNETSLAERFRCTIYFLELYKTMLWVFVNFHIGHSWEWKDKVYSVFPLHTLSRNPWENFLSIALWFKYAADQSDPTESWLDINWCFTSDYRT